MMLSHKKHRDPNRDHDAFLLRKKLIDCLKEMLIIRRFMRDKIMYTDLSFPHIACRLHPLQSPRCSFFRILYLKAAVHPSALLYKVQQLLLSVDGHPCALFDPYKDTHGKTHDR